MSSDTGGLEPTSQHPEPENEVEGDNLPDTKRQKTVDDQPVHREARVRAVLESRHKDQIASTFDELQEEHAPNTKNLLIAFATRLGINKVLMSKKSLLLVYATVNRSKGILEDSPPEKEEADKNN